MPVHEDPTRTRPSLDSQEGQKASSWPTRTSRWAQTDGSLLTDRAMFTNFTSPRYLKFLSLPCCGLADDFLFYGGYGVEPPGLVICSGIGVLNCARMTATGPFKLSAPGPASCCNKMRMSVIECECMLNLECVSKRHRSSKMVAECKNRPGWKS